MELLRTDKGDAARRERMIFLWYSMNRVDSQHRNVPRESWPDSDRDSYNAMRKEFHEIDRKISRGNS